MATNQPDIQRAPRHEASARPHRLRWIVLGLLVVFIVGAVAGVLVFRNVLLPAQQQRVLGMLPFMEAFLDRPDPNATLPTPIPQEGGIDPLSLLDAPLVATDDATADVTTLEAGFAPTDVPETSSLLNTALASLTGANLAQAQEVADTQGSGRPDQNHLFGFQWALQTWNNCGPANITMALSYFGWGEDQAYAGNILKPNREDKNVSPHELVQFVNEQTGVRAITRMGGNVEVLKDLIGAGFPVIIETGSTAFEGYDWIGHYRTIVGYDDNQQLFFIYDTYLGMGQNEAGIGVPYTQLDHDWQAFNRVFIVLYEQSRESEVARILGPLADVTQAAEQALLVAQQEARANPQNQFAWFNMGTSLTKLGDYARAAVAYDQASRIGLNFRMLWYQFGPFEAYFNTQRYDDVMSYVNTNLTNGGEFVEETHYWQGRVYEAQGQTNQARQAYQRALQHNSNFTLAQQALDALTA